VTKDGDGASARRLLLLTAAVVLAAATGGVARDRPSTAADANPASRAGDLVLLTIDTLRADALGFAGNRQVETPQLDRLANEGTVFLDAHAHNVVTLPSHANILTGLYPYQHGVRENAGFRLADRFATLATALHDAGFATGAFVSGYPLAARFGLARGFDTYDDRFSNTVRDGEMLLAERRGDEAVAAALSWWRSAAARRRFLWLHLYDPHAPYAPPEPFASRYRSQPYLGEVAAVDAYLAPLVDELRSSPRPVHVVFTADHGEALGDHGEQTHGLFCYEATLHVPLVLWGSGIAAQRDPRPARHVDIFPTLLALAGLDSPADGAGERPGRSLLAPPIEQPTDSYFEALSATLNRGWAPLRGLLRDRTKAIALPLPELYELTSDPGETTNLVEESRRRFRELAATLPVESRWPPERGAVDREATSRLAALGYLSGSAGGKSTWGAEDDPKTLLPLDRQLFDLMAAFSAGRLTEALELARRVVAARPGMPLGRSLLAQTLLEAGRRAEAVAEMRRARADGVTTDTLLRQLALSLSQEGDTAEALDVLAPLVAAGDLDARAARALVLSDAGRNAEALAELEPLLAEHPDEARALENAALAALRLGRPAAARDYARRAVAVSAGAAGAWNDLGVALFQLRDRDGALAAWQRAVEIDPRLWDALWNLGVQAARAGRFDVARRALSAFAERAPAERYRADKEEARRLLAALEKAPD